MHQNWVVCRTFLEIGRARCPESKGYDIFYYLPVVSPLKINGRTPKRFFLSKSGKAFCCATHASSRKQTQYHKPLGSLRSGFFDAFEPPLMDFTEIYKAKHASFSPDGKHVLATVDNRVVVRLTATFQITHTWLVEGGSATSSLGGANNGTGARSDPYSTAGAGPSSSGPRNSANTNQEIQCAWSTDSRYILAARSSSPGGNNPASGSGIVHVFDIIDATWNATIQPGIEGLTKAVWAPDGRSILCFSEWGVSLGLFALSGPAAGWITLH